MIDPMGLSGGYITALRQWLTSNITENVLMDSLTRASGILLNIPTSAGGAVTFILTNPQTAGIPNEGATARLECEVNQSITNDIPLQKLLGSSYDSLLPADLQPNSNYSPNVSTESEYYITAPLAK